MCVWLVWPPGMQDDYNKYGEPTEKEEDIDRGCRSISTLEFVQEVWEKLRISCESKCKKKKKSLKVWHSLGSQSEEFSVISSP